MERVIVNKRIQSLFKSNKAITFDEITLEDKPSDIHPNNVNLDTHITKNIKLKGCGILSSCMDTVTEKELALALAKMGGLGIIHKNMSPEEQVNMVKWVRHKIHYGGMIDNPIKYKITDRLSTVQNDIELNKWTFTSFPIVDEGKLVGLITKDEMCFVESNNPKLGDIMKPLSEIIVGNEKMSTEDAYGVMLKERIKKLPIVDENGIFIGMYVWNDIKNDERKKNLFSLDRDGHFLVGAAIGVGENEYKRAEQLIDNGCKVLVIDTSHGACTPVVEIVGKIKQKYGEKVDLIVGNIASYESAAYLLKQKYKPDALRVGISVGSICTTRRVTGHGMPQMTAIFQVWKAVNELNLDIPIIADGGIRYSGDIVKALAAGASGVMMGSIFGGAEESPGQVITHKGGKFKMVRGMASRGAMESRAGSRMRYFDKSSEKVDLLTNQQKMKITPEGVEGLTKYRGTVEDIMNEFLGGIRAGLAHSGAKNINEFRGKVTGWRQSYTGIIEAQPHSIINIRN